MFLFPSFVRLLKFLIPICIFSTTYLYLYPAFHRCYFPVPSNDQVAPFRLLAFGDPQLEGDTSFPSPPDIYNVDLSALKGHLRDREFSSLFEVTKRYALSRVELVSYYLKYTRKYIDLVGNDFYLAHIYRTLHWWSVPTHVTVLGDLLGSQWIGDEEFEERSRRFWNRVFAGAKKIPEEILNPNITGHYVTRREILGEDPTWSERVINVPGNHDIGYSGDVKDERIARFERAFGPVNGDIIFSLPQNSSKTPSPKIRLVGLNSMTLDGPAFSHDLHVSTVEFVNAVMTYSAPVETHDTATILLTHIPLHKEPGVCVDEPLFTYMDEVYGGGVKEQNFLAPGTSKDAILQGIFGFHSSTTAAARGMGRDGIILTGHDHEGCDVYHYANRETETWHAQRWTDSGTADLVTNDDVPGIREVTVRSMMGEFGGNAALVAAWWNEDSGRWSIEASNCRLGVQHIWWTIHSLDLAALVITIMTFAIYVVEKGVAASTDKTPPVRTEKGTQFQRQKVVEAPKKSPVQKRPNR